MNKEQEAERFRFFKELQNESNRVLNYSFIRTIGTFVKFLNRDEVSSIQSMNSKGGLVLYTRDSLSKIKEWDQVQISSLVLIESQELFLIARIDDYEQ